jgi:hypothetical protein
MPGAWPTWLEVPEEPEEPVVGAAEQEAPEEPNIEDEAGDQPQVTYMLDQF